MSAKDINSARAPRLTIRLDLGPRARFGHGKARLLEAVAAEGSLSGAARAVKMSYRRAWLLIAETNAMFKRPLVTAKKGGKAGGRAELTAEGKSVLALYRDVERKAARAAAASLKKLQSAARKT